MFPFGFSGRQQEQPVHLRAFPLLFSFKVQNGDATLKVNGLKCVEMAEWYKITSFLGQDTTGHFRAPDHAGVPRSHPGHADTQGSLLAMFLLAPTSAHRSLLGR